MGRSAQVLPVVALAVSILLVLACPWAVSQPAEPPMDQGLLTLAPRLPGVLPFRAPFLRLEVPEGCRYLSFSPDRRLLACTDRQDGVHLFDLRTGQVVWHWAYPELMATSLGILVWPWSPLAKDAWRDGRWRLSVIPGTPTGWPGDTGAMFAPEGLQLAIVHNACLSNSHVVVAHPEGVSVTPGVWLLGGYVHFFGEPALELRLTVEVDRPEQLPMSTTILHGLAPVTAFDIDPGGLYAATGTTEGLLTLWSVDSGQQLARVVGEREPAASPSLNALAFSPDGRWLASIGASGDVRLWSVPGLVLGSELIGHRDAGFWVGVSPDGERIASASLDGDVRVWDRRTGATVHVLDWREAAGDSPRFAYAPRGGGIMFAATRRGGVMGMLSDGVGRLQYAQPVDLSRITAFARSPGGEFVTAGDDEGRILVWSTL